MNRPVRSAGDRGQAEAWTLTLASQRIESKLQPADGRWLVLVDEGDFDRAAAELDAYDRERFPSPVELPQAHGPTLAGLLAALALVGFDVAMVRVQLPWLERGGASSSAILDGELWRALTALTLHVDGPHLAGNALFLAAFGTAVCWSLGPGAGLALILASAAAANLANATLYGVGHFSVGASTAVFAAIGILAGARFAALRASGAGSRRAWLPLAAGVALLGFLGTSPRADLGAHLLGLAAGAAGGAAFAGIAPRPLGAPAQRACLAGAAIALTAAWYVALA